MSKVIGPMRRGQAREYLGVSERTFRKLIENGDIGRVHLAYDHKKRPIGRAFYRRTDLEKIKERIF